MAYIVCRDISLGYDGRTIVENLSFEVESGDYLCVVGENGAGKSTLMKTLLGLNKPTRGQILTEEGFSNRGIGYLPQQTEFQRDFPATVWEIILSGCVSRCEGRPFLGRREKAGAFENMKKLGIESLKKSCYRELSGGQQQRVLLARALCSARELLLLDEPAAGLDPMATNELYHLIMELNRRENLTVVMVSHDIQAAVKHAKHILHLGEKSLFFGTASDYAQSQVGQMFLNLGKCGRCEE